MFNICPNVWMLINRRRFEVVEQIRMFFRVWSVRSLFLDDADGIVKKTLFNFPKQQDFRPDW